VGSNPPSRPALAVSAPTLTPHASVIYLDGADTLTDTLYCGRPRLSADRIAAPMPSLYTTRSSMDTRDLTLVGLKIRKGEAT
jgi:hypothetical protein